jgi:transposase
MVVSLRENGSSQCKIADTLGVSQSCISRFLLKFNQNGSTENLPRSDRPRKTDEQGDRKFLRSVKTDRRQTLLEITNDVNNFLPSLCPAEL